MSPLVDLRYIEDEAGTLAETTDELDRVERELARIDDEIDEARRRREGAGLLDRLLGRDGPSDGYVEDLEESRKRLAERRETLESEVDRGRARIAEMVASDELTVPLTTEPDERHGAWVFDFEGAREFEHAIGFLAEETGRGTPLRVGEVTVTGEQVQVPQTAAEGEAEAMEAVMEAFDALKADLRVGD